MSEYQGDTCCEPQVKDPDLKSYVGTKIILAKPMSEEEWLLSKGTPPNPLRETGGQGYLVIYDNGYRSWSPKHVFEGAYRLLTQTEKITANF